MDELKNDPKFIAFLQEMLPNNFKKKTLEQKIELINRFEDYACIIQRRQRLDILVSTELTGGLINLKTKQVLISSLFLDSSIDVMKTIFHEGYHLVTLEHNKHKEQLQEKDFYLYKLNYATSLINEYMLGYFSSADNLFNYFNYFHQPAEYASFKEGYVKTKEILSLMEKKFNKWGLKLLLDINYITKHFFNPKNFFSNEYYEKTVYPTQVKLMKIAYDRIQADRRLTKYYNQLSKSLNFKLQKLKGKEVSKKDLVVYFFPNCWLFLPTIDKKYVYSTYAALEGLKLSEQEIAEGIKNNNMDALESIYRYKANKEIAKQTGIEKDYLLGVEIFANVDQPKQRIEKKQANEIMNGKSIDLFYEYSEVKDIYFLLPKYKIIRDEYAQKILDAIKELKSVFGTGASLFTEVYNLEKRAVFLNEPINLYKKSVAKFEKDFSR